MNTSFSKIAAILLATTAFLCAADAEPEKTEASTASPAAETSETLPPYELKKRSAFLAVEENARAPFWPIGWVKRVTGAPVQTEDVAAAPGVQLDEKNFKVTSILLGAGTASSLAVINGRAYGEGEFLRMPKGGTTPPVKVRVQRINDGQVILQNATQTLVVALQRPELSTKREAEVFLDPDR
jgi:hypothetical protein